MCDAIESGETSRERVSALGRAKLVAPAEEAYLDVVDSVTFAPCDPIVRPYTLVGSVQLGATRIIDNIPLQARGQKVRF
jgi:pantothenate synthetase